MHIRNDIPNNLGIPELMSATLGQQQLENLQPPRENPHSKGRSIAAADKELTTCRLFHAAILQALAVWHS